MVLCLRAQRLAANRFRLEHNCDLHEDKAVQIMYGCMYSIRFLRVFGNRGSVFSWGPEGERFEIQRAEDPLWKSDWLMERYHFTVTSMHEYRIPKKQKTV